jgi:hypothetical protein
MLANRLSANRLLANCLSANCLSANHLSANRLSVNRLSVNCPGAGKVPSQWFWSTNWNLIQNLNRAGYLFVELVT